MIEALADGAVKQGVPRQMALQFAAQTVLGAAKTVLQTEKHPAVLRDEVSGYDLENTIRENLFRLKIEKKHLKMNLKFVFFRYVRRVDPPSLVCMNSKK